MYGVNITKETQSEQNVIREFTSGKHEGVKLESVEFKALNQKINNNEPVLCFNFRGENEEKYTFIEYPIDSSRENWEKSAESQGIRIKHILTKFVPEEQVVLENANSYADFANKIIAILGETNVGKTVAIKMVYNSKGKLGFTPYKGFIANNILDLKIGNNELMTKPSATPSTHADLGLDNTADINGGGQAPTDELPFN